MEHVLIDYHLHYHDHGESGDYSLDRIREFVDVGAGRGVHELGFTEHIFRFREVVELLGEWWEDEPDKALRDYCARYFAAHSTQSLDDYVSMIESARAEGLPVRLGLEIDYYPGKMRELARFLDGYPLDFRLGAVHWIGGWGFDDPGVVDEWKRRDVDEVWTGYFDALVELIETGCADVLAHPDLVKKFGFRPEVEPVEMYDRVIEAASAGGIAIEVSSAGLRKPVREAYPSADFLRRANGRGVAITTASDAHCATDVGRDFDQIRQLVKSAGYETVASFIDRSVVAVPLGGDSA